MVKPVNVYLSIVVPVYNESESIEKMARKILETMEKRSVTHEVILVDDGSTDGSWVVIENLVDTCPRVRGIRFRRNYGQTGAMVAGFDNARGKIIVTMDGDLQNDPADIPLLLDRIEEGFDIVSGWRKNRRDHFSRVFLSRIANRIISFSTGVRLHDYGCSLKAYRAECIRGVDAYGEMHRFFPALASMTGARVTEVTVGHGPRKYGSSKYGFERIWKVFSDIFAINLIIRFSSMPLKGFALCALPFLFLSLVFCAAGGAAILWGWSEGKALFFLFSGILNWMAAVHLVGMGILGELVIGTSDLAHTQMPEITKKVIQLEEDFRWGEKKDEVLGNRSAGREKSKYTAVH